MNRWANTWDTQVLVEVFGQQLKLQQDPNSYSHGTTVWDASLVFAKYVERQRSSGDFCRARLRGKRALELGAGAGGVAGMALALSGAHVALTDLQEVLPLLRANVANNVTPAALRVGGDDGAAGDVGRAEVGELDWFNRDTWRPYLQQAPFDYIIATDCVYSETAVPALLDVVLAMCGRRTLVAVCNEFRSQSVHDVFMSICGQHFSIKQVPAKALDPEFSHPLIKIYLLKLKKTLGSKAAERMSSPAAGDAEAACELDASASSSAINGTVAGKTAVDGEAAAAGPSSGASVAAARAASQDEAATAAPAVASSGSLKPPLELC